MRGNGHSTVWDAQQKVDRLLEKASVMPAEAEPPKPMKLVWYAELNEPVHQVHLIHGLILVGTLFVVYGESNSGKTFLMVDLALGVAAGNTWRGRPTQRGLVVYIAGEGAGSVRTRVHAYRQEHPEISAGLPFAIIPYAVDFMDAESIDVLIATVKAAESECGESAVLIIVDTYARALHGGDENSSKDAGVAVAAADRIRLATGAAVGFVHHAGKDTTKGARGSSALRAAVDTEILIEGQSGTRTAVITKQRDLAGGERLPFDLKMVELAPATLDGPAVTSCVVQHLEADQAAVTPQTAAKLNGRAQKQFLAVMRARKEDREKIYSLTDLREIGRLAGMSKGTARSVVDTLALSHFFRKAAFGYLFTDGVEG